MEKMKVYLAVSIIDGKAEVSQIAERYFNDYSWRLRMQEKAAKGEYQIYFTETEIFHQTTTKEQNLYENEEL